MSIWARVAAAKVYEQAKQQEKQHEALLQADHDSRMLLGLPSPPVAVISRCWLYFHYTGQDDLALEGLRQASETAEDDFVKSFGPSRGNQLDGHFYIALVHLADGDRLGASEHFRKAAETQVINWLSYDWSCAFLKRMEKDPTWPPWILVKK